MRIGLLTASLSRQGANVSAALSALARSLHRPPELNVAAFGLWDEMTEPDLGTWTGMTVTATTRRGLRKFGFSRDLDQALAQAELDLLHIHGLWTYASVASRRWADATARPYIIAPHGMLDPWALRRSRWKKMCAALLFEIAHLRGAACLHARCEAEAQAFRDLRLRNPICIVSNAVDSTPLGNGYLAPGNGMREHILVCFGPPSLDGNGRSLLRAWQLACARSATCGATWSLVLVVSDEDRATFTRECTTLGLEKVVLFLPSSASAAPALWDSASAVVLLPAASEQTMSAHRAWSHGLPVLTCSSGGTYEAVCAAPALSVQPTVECLAEGLLTLCEMTDTERAEMGATARKLIETRVAPAAIAEDMRQVYRWVLGCGPKPSCVVDP